MRSRMARRGFTLIELLVVIAIIAILAAILFPVFAAAQKSALKSRCVNNEKQILVAILQYAQDNGGRVPPGYDPSISSPYNWTNGVFGAMWHERIMRYVRNKEVFLCPSVPMGLYASSSKYFKYSSYPTTYGLNWRLCSGGGQVGGVAYYPHTPVATLRSLNLFGNTVTPEAIRAPSKVILICEAQHRATRVLDKSLVDSTVQGGAGAMVYGDSGQFPYYWMVRWLNSPFLPQGHGGGANFGMVDGHVQYVRGLQPNLSSSTGSGTPPVDSSVERAGLRWW